MGSNAAPHYFSLEGIDSSPSFCNHGLKIGSYAPVGHYTKVLKDNEQNRGPLTKHGPEQQTTLKCPRLNARSTLKLTCADHPNLCNSPLVSMD
jgi:hypothetical protein